MNDQQPIEAEYHEVEQPHAQQTTALVQQSQAGGAVMTVDQMHSQVQTIKQVMDRVMKNGEHYGTIPGCGDKPTLLQPGATKLALTFGFAPEYVVAQTNLPNGHREYEIRCRLTHRQTGGFIGEGVGCCSTMESKYRWRQGERKCPSCGKPSIIKGKPEYGGGWLCFARKGGCGAKFQDNDQTITGQNTGRVENPDIADQYNTVLKMGKKRALVDAVLTATAASDMFTQDLEDLPPAGGDGSGQGTAPPAGGQQQQPQSAPPPQQQTAPPPQQQAPPPQQSAPPQQQPPQQQPQQNQQNQANNGSSVVEVEAVTQVKTGQNANGPWTLHGIKATDGTVYKTFNNDHASIAGEAREAGTQVTIRWTRDQYGFKAEDVSHVAGQGAQQQQAEPTLENPANCTVTDVQVNDQQMSDGSTGKLWRITTNRGRLGCFDPNVGAAIEQAHRDGAGVMIGWEQKPQGYLAIAADVIPF